MADGIGLLRILRCGNRLNVTICARLLVIPTRACLIYVMQYQNRFPNINYRFTSIELQHLRQDSTLQPFSANSKLSHQAEQEHAGQLVSFLNWLNTAANDSIADRRRLDSPPNPHVKRLRTSFVSRLKGLYTNLIDRPPLRCGCNELEPGLQTGKGAQHFVLCRQVADFMF